MNNQIQTASEVKDSSLASTLAHETRTFAAHSAGKNFLSYFVVVAFALSLAFTACNDKENPDDFEQLFAGKFASHTGGGEAVFYAGYATEAQSGLLATEKKLVGKIQDGAIIFDLSGVHNTQTGRFLLSAGSSNLIYQISGTFSAGSITNTRVYTKINSLAKSSESGDESDWDLRESVVTSSNDVSITGSVSNTQEAGLPREWFGTWEFKDGDRTHRWTFTAFQASEYVPDGFINIARQNPKKNVDIDSWDYHGIVPKPNAKRYEMIFQNFRVEDGIAIYPIYFLLWIEEYEDKLVMSMIDNTYNLTAAGAAAKALELFTSTGVADGIYGNCDDRRADHCVWVAGCQCVSGECHCGDECYCGDECHCSGICWCGYEDDEECECEGWWECDDAYWDTECIEAQVFILYRP